MFSSSRSISRWSTVALPFLPPAWASVMLMSFLALSFIILSYHFTKLLGSVIPPPFEHFPFIPFPLYIVMMLPSCHSSGISSVWLIVLSASRNISLVSLLASMNIAFCMLLGPALFSSLVSLWHYWFLFHRWSVVVLLFLGFFRFFWLCVWCDLSIFHIPGCLLWLGIVVSSRPLCNVLFPAGLWFFFRLPLLSHRGRFAFVFLFVYLVSRSSLSWSLLHCLVF